MLSKKHYIKIAEILKNGNYSAIPYHNQTAGEVIHDVILDFIEYFEQDNPAFDVDKFNRIVYGDFV
ncbi:MAG: hypothetical protein KAS32_04830 [Candidatus Peribacteraceae bacterium]|nr:hypothetical protein [Candidatus Peribacteraceae bacterium]